MQTSLLLYMICIDFKCTLKLQHSISQAHLFIDSLNACLEPVLAGIFVLSLFSIDSQLNSKRTQSKETLERKSSSEILEQQRYVVGVF